MQGPTMMSYSNYPYYQFHPPSGPYNQLSRAQPHPVYCSQLQQTYQHHPGKELSEKDQPPYYPYTNLSYGNNFPPPPRQPNFQSAIDNKETNYDLPRQSHKTPQPKPLTQLYNGPPVSALVPRQNKRASSLMRSNISSNPFTVGKSPLGTDITKQNKEENSKEPEISFSSAPQLDAAVVKMEQVQSQKLQSSPSVRQPLIEIAKNLSTSDKSPQKPLSPIKDGECFPCTVPIDFPRRLALPNDPVKLNSLHCFLREKILEIFVVTPSSNKLKFRHAPSSSVGRVGLRCGFCASARVGVNNAPDDEAPMAVFYPKSVSEIYRLVTSWQRCHVRKCKNLPPSLRKEWEQLRHDKTRGKTVYWAESAAQLGMVDCKTLAGGIRFKVDPATGKCMQTYKDE